MKITQFVKWVQNTSCGESTRNCRQFYILHDHSFHSLALDPDQDYHTDPDQDGFSIDAGHHPDDHHSGLDDEDDPDGYFIDVGHDEEINLAVRTEHALP